MSENTKHFLVAGDILSSFIVGPNIAGLLKQFVKIESTFQRQ